MSNFDNFLCDRNEDIDDAAFELLKSLVIEPEKFEWNQSIIGPIVDYTEGLLANNKIDICHPFYEGEDESPCFESSDCNRENCPYKKLEKAKVK